MEMSKNKTFFGALKVAGLGLFVAFFSERNMKIHALAAGLTVFAAYFFDISATHFALLLLCIGIVVSLELVNSALELVVDLVTKEFNPLAKKAKDTAAAAVLFASIVSVFIAILIFTQYFSLLKNWGLF